MKNKSLSLSAITCFCPRFSSRRPRRGAAILVVVGMLAILLITAVAFTILMRVERGASANFRHDAGARQMLYVALAQAIADIDAAPPLGVGDDVYPPWGAAFIWTNGSHHVTLPPDVLLSIDTNVNNSSNVLVAHILSQEAMKYVPRSLRASLQTAKPEWRGVDVGTGPIGRYAYIVVNVSGLLDANVVGDPNTNRWIGADPREIQLNTTLLPDLADTNLFLTSRASNIRYETLKDLAEHSAGITTNLSSFEVFSRAPDMMQPGNLTNKVWIGGSADDIHANHAAIVQAFMDCGVSALNLGADSATASEWAYRALVDYVDSEDPPQLEGSTPIEKFARPSSEAVPMISSVYMTMAYDSTNTMTYNFEVLCSKPYEQAMPDYRILVDLSFFPSPNPGDIDPPEASGLLPTDPAILHFESLPNDNYAQLNNVPVIAAALTNATVNLCFTTYFAVKIVSETDPSIVFDEVDNNVGASVELFNKHEFTVDAPFYTNRAEVVDPRINWNGARGNKQWRCYDDFEHDSSGVTDFIPLGSTDMQTYWPDYTPSYIFGNWGSFAEYCLSHANGAQVPLGGFGILTDGMRLQEDTGGIVHNESQWDRIEEQVRCFVANRPLQSVGELGFLPINQYLTLTLYNHKHSPSQVPNGILPASGYHPVLDYFTVRPPTNRVSRGLVAVNSQNTNVQASVLFNLPLQDWRDPSASARLSNVADVRTLAHWFTTQPTNGISRLSEIGNAWWEHANVLGAHGAQVPASEVPAFALSQAIFDATGGSTNYAFGEFEREALIRNTAELYTTRQQFFTIIVRADSLTTKYGFGDVKNSHTLGSAQAVFQVWRDPVKGADGKHHCFVRLFKVL